MNKTNSKYSILKIFWLILGILTAGMFLYSLVVDGFKIAWPFALMSLFSFLFYWVRRNQANKVN
jgi:hypothetical protein